MLSWYEIPLLGTTVTAGTIVSGPDTNSLLDQCVEFCSQVQEVLNSYFPLMKGKDAVELGTTVIHMGRTIWRLV